MTETHAEPTATYLAPQTAYVVIDHDSDADFSWLEQDCYNPAHPSYEPTYRTEADMKARRAPIDGDWYRDPKNHVTLEMTAYDENDNIVDSTGGIDFLAGSDAWQTGTFTRLSHLKRSPYLQELARDMGLPD